MTEKQKRFVDEYLISANASDAARKAGYSKKSARVIGQENLERVGKLKICIVILSVIKKLA